ncbi:MAG: hypothetical protein ACOY45_15155 [Pseudomonadota bacterium]
MRPSGAFPLILLLAGACSQQAPHEPVGANSATAAADAAEATPVADAEPAPPALAPTPSPAETAAASGPPYPGAEVLAAFNQACGALRSPAATRKAIADGGWSAMAKTDATPIGDLVAFGKRAGAALARKAGGEVARTDAYRRTVAGEALFLVLSEAKVDGRTLLGCRVYDPGETRRITATDAQALAGRPPLAITDQPEIQRARWEPGLAGPHSRFEVYFVPEGSPAVRLTRIAGIALAADRAIEP